MKFRVRDGFIVKIGEGQDDEKRFKSGDVVDLTPEEHARHAHKLEPAEAPRAKAA